MGIGHPLPGLASEEERNSSGSWDGGFGLRMKNAAPRIAAASTSSKSGLAYLGRATAKA